MLEITDIHVSYGDIEALRGVSLTVGDGEMIALVGANGAGKTTTLRTITGLMSPRSGEITFDGERIDGLAAYDVVDRGVAHLPEGRELFSDLSVMDNLRLGNWRRRKSGSFRTRRDEVMDHFPILRQRSGQDAGTLSGGEQQMLGVARALMSGPKLLVVDELSLGLAPKIVSQLFEILRAVNAEGTSVLLVEQFVHMALGNTHRAYALAKGEVVMEGASSELADSPELMAVYLGEDGSSDAGAGVVAGGDVAGEPDARTPESGGPIVVSDSGTGSVRSVFEDGSGDERAGDESEPDGVDTWGFEWDDDPDDFDSFDPFEPTGEIPPIDEPGSPQEDPGSDDDDRARSDAANLDPTGDDWWRSAEGGRSATDDDVVDQDEPTLTNSDESSVPAVDRVDADASVAGSAAIEVRVRRR